MSSQVEAILQQIEQLDEADRIIVERRLHELAEAAWQQEAERARALAQQQGIDQQRIDDAIKDLRYGT